MRANISLDASDLANPETTRNTLDDGRFQIYTGGKYASDATVAYLWPSEVRQIAEAWAALADLMEADQPIELTPTGKNPHQDQSVDPESIEGDTGPTRPGGHDWTVTADGAWMR